MSEILPHDEHAPDPKDDDLEILRQNEWLNGRSNLKIPEREQLNGGGRRRDYGDNDTGSAPTKDRAQQEQWHQGQAERSRQSKQSRRRNVACCLQRRFG